MRTALRLSLAPAATYMILALQQPAPYSAPTILRGLGPLLEALGLAGLLLVVLEGRFQALAACLRNPALVNLGLISYSVYAVHYLLIEMEPRVLRRLSIPEGLTELPRSLSLIAASIAAGTITWFLLERPFQVAAPSRAPLRNA